MVKLIPKIKKLSIGLIDVNITELFLIWYLTIIIIFSLSYMSFPHGMMFHGSWFASLANWDGDHFLAAAKDGYDVQNRLAFFPLYPLLIRGLTYLTSNYLLSAIVINFVASLLTVNIFYRLVLTQFGKTIAHKSVITLLVFPTSFFLVAAYSESLFLLLVVLTFYFIQKQKFLWAVIMVNLACLTRLVGLALVVMIFIEALRNQSFKQKWLAGFSTIGFLGYIGYQYIQTGDFFYLITAEGNWQRYISIPGWSVWQAIQMIMAFGINTWSISIFIDLVFTIVGLGLTFRAFRFLPLRYSIYGLISIIIPLFTSTLLSMPRFLLTIFPLFILIAMIKNNRSFFTLQLLSGILLLLFAALYINGYWVS